MFYISLVSNKLALSTIFKMASDGTYDFKDPPTDKLLCLICMEVAKMILSNMPVARFCANLASGRIPKIDALTVGDLLTTFRIVRGEYKALIFFFEWLQFVLL